MNLTKSQKIWLGIGTFLPAIFGIIVAIMAITFAMSVAATESMGGNPEAFVESIIGTTSVVGIGFLIITSLVLSAASLVVLIVYILHAVKQQKFSSTERVVWILLFVLIGFIAEVIYFFMYIVKSNSGNEKSNDSQGQAKVAAAG
ncbi:hypothetical protein [Halocola ammonii]